MACMACAMHAVVCLRQQSCAGYCQHACIRQTRGSATLAQVRVGAQAQGYVADFVLLAVISLGSWGRPLHVVCVFSGIVTRNVCSVGEHTKCVLSCVHASQLGVQCHALPVTLVFNGTPPLPSPVAPAPHFTVLPIVPVDGGGG